MYKEGTVVPFTVEGGLVKPNRGDSDSPNLEQSQAYCRPSWLGFFSGLKGKMGSPRINMKVLVLLVALMSLFSGVSGEIHDLAKSMGEVRWGENPNPNPNPINPIRKSRVRRGNNDKSDSILMHAKKGHPHDPLCDVCMHARMRGKMHRELASMTCK